MKASFATALFTLIYFGVGIFIIYFFRKRHTGRFGGQGYKFPAIIYFVSIPIIIAIGTDFFRDYDPDAIYSFGIDLGLWGTVIIFGIVPTVIYIAIGLYILSREHTTGRPGYKLPALIYFISVPSLIVIAITLHFGMTYMTGAFENKLGPKPAGYSLYKFLVLKDIIPRSGTSLDEKETAEDSKKYSVKVEYKSERVEKNETKETESSQTVEKVNFKEIDLNNTKKLNFREHGPFFGIKENGLMVRGIYKLPKNETLQTDYYGLFTKDEMFWKGYSKHRYNDGRIIYQYNEYQLDNEGKVIQLDTEGNRVFKNGIFQIVDSYVITEDDFEKVKKYIRYDIPIPFSFYNFEDTKTEIAQKEESKEDINKDVIKPKINQEGKIIKYKCYGLNFRNKPLIINKKNKVVKYDQYNSQIIYDVGKYIIFNLYDGKNYMGGGYRYFNTISGDLGKIDGVNKEKVIENFDSIFYDGSLIETFYKPIVNCAYPEKIIIAEKKTTIKSDEKYYALVIGNNNYEHLEKLDAAQKDAEVIAEVLQDKYGFEVDLLLNADQETTVDTLFNITDKLKKNDNLLIYYAGHGELDKAENRGYWLPVDASYEKRSKWISNQRIVDRIKATKAKHVLLMVDSCFSGTLMRSGITTEVNETMSEKNIERLKKKKTRLVITSGGNEPVVDSDGGQHSLFALKLIDILKNNNGVINSSRLFEPIKEYVSDNADQTPERAKVHKTGHDGGDFLFFAKN